MGCSHPLRATLVRLFCILLFVPVLPVAYAQNPPSPVSVIQVPSDGMLLSEGWRFRFGDDLNGASPQLDDRQWSRLDPTNDLRDLPQLRRTGIGWLRLHLRTGPNLPPLLVHVVQSVASEIYLDGRLLYRFGTVSTNPDRVQASNPGAAFSLPLRSSSRHLLAVRFALQPGLDYQKKYLNWDATALQLRLIPTTRIPALQPISRQAAYLDTFRVGIAFILFVLHLSLFFAYRRQRANLYAAGLYLLLTLSYLARVADGFVHSLNARLTIQHVVLLDAWVPGVAILTFYSLFDIRKDWLFWLAIGSTAVRFISLPADYQWLNLAVAYFHHFLPCWLAVVATRRRLLGAHIVRVGVLCNLGLLPAFSILSAFQVSFTGHEWLYHTLYLMAFLCIPLTLSLRLALEHGWVNRQLMARLRDVEDLSARNLAQQREREQLLARQNEQLERQVAERTQKLHQQADQLRELDGAKSRFFSNVTHEFRTPLSLIIAPVEKLLQQGRFDRPTLTTVHRNAGQLLRLINQLLDLAKLEGNYMPVSPMRGDVTEFISHTVELFRRSAEQKEITLTCSLDPSFPQDAVFDADKWEKILTNLLVNALKFTPPDGHVNLTGTPVWTTGQLTGVQLALVDSGIGMVPDKLPHIFDRFYQADTSSTRPYEGTGIGLALVHELVSLLGGTITVESAPNAGTTFRLTLPVQPVSAAVDAPQLSWSVPEPAAEPLLAAPPVPALVTKQPGIGQSVPCILIVEDNDELREFLVAELTPSYQILQAADGQAGWELIQAELPDIVLTDVMMPRMNGYALTRLIKDHPDTDHIAVVMLTAKAAQPSRIDGLQQGADDYLSKPFSIEELHLRLRNLISRQAKLGEHYRRQFGLPGAVGAPMDSPGRSGVPVDSPDVRPDPFLLRIYALLDRHLDDSSIGVDWLSDQLAMNRKTLYRKLQTLIQLPPADLIRQYRLRKAAELLRAGRNVSETADLVGFNTPSHFTTVFRDFYQQTPTEFTAGRVK